MDLAQHVPFSRQQFVNVMTQNSALIFVALIGVNSQHVISNLNTNSQQK